MLLLLRAQSVKLVRESLVKVTASKVAPLPALPATLFFALILA